MDRKQFFTSAPNRTLLDVLRDDLGLTGAKDACGGEGECGACYGFFGWKIDQFLYGLHWASGWLTRLPRLKVLLTPGTLHPLQEAFVEAGAVQCGYCTPGAILSAKALLDRTPQPSEAEIRESLSGNLCRCTGYTKMVDAVRLAAKEVEP